MRKTSLLLMMLTFFVGTMMAQQVSVDEAMSRAKTFLQSKSPRRAPSVSGASAATELTLAYTAQSITNQKTCFYVFNNVNGDGFIIVGGDETAQEILGYSDNGTFDYATAPENFKWWLRQYAGQISAAMDYAEAHPEAVATAKAKAARKTVKTTKTDVTPLVTAKWDQTDPYNSKLPSLGEGYTGNSALATGCVATAMAQIMKRYNYPTHGKGSHSYTKTFSDGVGTKTFEANFANTTYDWDNMTDTYDNSSTQAEKDAVGTLMYHCGVAVDMGYGQIQGGGSAAYSYSIAPALVNYFRYSNAVRYVDRDYYKDAAWENMIYNELANNRPVLYTGDATGGSGHAFVCDGYKSSDDTYDINWGWSGHYNGYFKITGTNALTPDGTGTGGSASGSSYVVSQSATVNIIANEGGLETPVLYNNTGTMTLIDGSNNITTYTHAHGSSKTLTLKENVWNQSRSLTSFTLAVKATDTTTGLEYYLASQNLSTFNVNNYSDMSISFDVDKLEYNGTYEISLVARNNSSSSNNDWYDVAVKNGITIPTVTVTGATDPQKTDVSFTIDNTTVEVSRSLQISYTSSYKGTVKYTSNDNSIATVDDNGVVTGVKEGTVTITAKAAGNTYFNETTKAFTVTVTPFVKSDVTASISATELYVGQTAQITLTDGYDGTATYKSTPSDIVSVSDAGTVTANAKGTAKITVNIPDTENYKGTTATFVITVSEAGLKFSQAPYFSNDNNPWEKDVVLHMPLYNASTETFTGNFKAEVSLTGGTVSYTCSMSNLPSGGTCDYTLNLTSYLDYFRKGIDSPKNIYFYSDADGKIPFNYPSITYTYRSTLTYNYELTSAGIGTLILPFNAEIPSTLRAYECNSMDGGTLVLNEATTLKRNTPYIITGTAGTYTFTGPKAIDNSPVLFGTGKLKGTLLSDSYQFQSGDYILQNQDAGVAFYKYTTGTGEWKASPYRAFLQPGLTQSLRYASIPGFTNGTTTAISAPENATSAKAAGIYSVNGAKLTQLQPGLNIIVDENGNTTKVFIKK